MTKILKTVMRPLDSEIELRKMCRSLKEILGDSPVIVELGSYMGESSMIFSQEFPRAKIYCIDSWEGGFDDSDSASHADYTEVEKQFDLRLKDMLNVEKLKGYTTDFSIECDMVYIDACHKYECVMEDIKHWAPLTRKVIAGHDYNTDEFIMYHQHIAGVKVAINESLGNPDNLYGDGSWYKKIKNFTNKKDMNLIQIGTNVANDDFSQIVKSIGKENIANLILVEPLVNLNEIINNCYSNFEYKLENLVITDNEDKLTEKFFISPSYNWLSSMSKNHIDKHIETTVIEQNVDCITLNNLFKKHNLNKIDILFIDAEGFDDKLIMSIDFEFFDIEKIYYEDFHIDNQNLINFLEDKGYKVVKADFQDGLTSVAIKNKK